MSDARDRDLGLDREITRRDFLNGLAIGAGGALLGGALPEALAAAQAREQQLEAGYYPPTRTGMRGSHDGSWEVAHALRDGRFWSTAGTPVDTGERYDLVVVGGGLSGLSAAYFYRERAGRNARILILDNHDDFGGHAKRNELHIGGRMLLVNGGTVGIDSPTPYSTVADGLLKSLGIDPAALQAKTRAAGGPSLAVPNLRNAFFFDKETFGADTLVVGVPGGGGRGGGGGEAARAAWNGFAAQTPLSEKARSDWRRIQFDDPVDYMPGVSVAEKRDRLSRMSYRRYLTELAKCDDAVANIYQRRTEGEWGVGIDAWPALDCWAMGFPGFKGLGLGEIGPVGRLSYTAAGYAAGGSYRFHYPDGNASVARLLVRALIPDAMPGRDAEDIVTAVADYSRLDRAASPVRLRLNSTVVRVQQPAGSKEVEVAYSSGRGVSTVRAGGVVLACWNMVIPAICPGLPAAQQEALHYLVKVPLVYTTIGLRNWKAFEKLGISNVSSPGMWHPGIGLNTAGPALGGYTGASGSPDEPILIRLTRTPNKPGLATARDQHRAGRAELLQTPFAVFERNIRDQFARVLGPGGFDPARDIESIIVNRWPHGYGYEYNPLYDPDWAPGQAPHEIGRKPFGRITIANSDSGATAYSDVAIDQAHRAVSELFA